MKALSTTAGWDDIVFNCNRTAGSDNGYGLENDTIRLNNTKDDTTNYVDISLTSIVKNLSANKTITDVELDYSDNHIIKFTYSN